MKRITFLTATAFTFVCLSGQPLITYAAPRMQVVKSGCSNQVQSYQKGNNIIFTYGNGCNVKDILNKLENCLPENNAPEADTPDNSTHAFVQEVVTLVNAERAKEGLSPLSIDIKVQAAAQVRAKECEQSFSHTRPNGTSFSTALKEQNVSYKSAGENIAWGQKSPQEVMNGWMNSSGHRANIMNPNFTTIGVGYYQNANGTNYWCQLFTR